MVIEDLDNTADGADGQSDDDMAYEAWEDKRQAAARGSEIAAKKMAEIDEIKRKIDL